MVPPTKPTLKGLKGGATSRPNAYRPQQPLQQNSVLLPSEFRAQATSKLTPPNDNQSPSSQGSARRSLGSVLVERETREEVASDQEKLDLAYSMYLQACTVNLITRELEALQDMYSAEELARHLGDMELIGICHNLQTVQLPAHEEIGKLKRVTEVGKVLKPYYMKMAEVFRSKKCQTLESFKTALEKEFGGILLNKEDKPFVIKSPLFQRAEELEEVIKNLEKEFLEEEQKEDNKVVFKNISKFSKVFLETLENMRQFSKESPVPRENQFLEFASQLATSEAVTRVEKKRNKKKNKKKAQSNNQADERDFEVDYQEEAEN